MVAAAPQRAYLPPSLPPFLHDARVVQRPVPRNLASAAIAGVLWQAAPGRFLLEAPDVARFLVTGGIEVAIDRHPGVAPVRLARFLRMAPLAALLYQRGLLACHGAVVATTRGAIMIAGVSAAGKSSVAAALVERGCQFLADDLAAVDLDAEGGPIVFATGTEIALWPGPRYLTFAGCDPATPVPLRAVCFLGRGRDSGGLSRFEFVTRMCYNSLIADTLLDHARFLRVAAAITRHVPVEHMVSSGVSWQAAVIADRILEKWC